MAIESSNPAIGEIVREPPPLTDGRLEPKLQRAHHAFRSYHRDTR